MSVIGSFLASARSALGSRRAKSILAGALVAVIVGFTQQYAAGAIPIPAGDKWLVDMFGPLLGFITTILSPSVHPAQGT